MLEKDPKYKIKVGLRMRIVREKRFGEQRGSMSAAARAMGMHPSAVLQLERGQWQQAADVLDAYVRFYGCNAGWLLTGQGEPFPETGMKVGGKLVTPAEAGSGVTIPIVAELHVTNTPSNGNNGSAEDHISVRFQWADPPSHPLPIKLAGMRLRGHQFEPFVSDGDLFMINLDQDASRSPAGESHSGEAAIVEVNEKYTVCRLYDEKDGYIYLAQLFPIRYAMPMRIHESKITKQYSILGLMKGEPREDQTEEAEQNELKQT